MATANQLTKNSTQLRRILIVLSVVGALLLGNLVGQAMATLPGSSFDGTDGVLDDDGDLLHLTDACGQSTDDGPYNGASTKLNVIHQDAPPTINPALNNPGKADICQVWIDSEVVDDDFLLYVAWERSSTTGSTVVFWEFHTQPLTCSSAAPDCNPFNPRSDGDFLLTYDFQGNDIDLAIRFWNVANNSFDPPSSIVPINSEASLSNDTSFGEAVLNLSDMEIIEPESDECESLSGVIPGSVTGNSDTADYKDIVLTNANPGVTNCGSIEVTKNVTGGDDFGATFPITLSDDGTIHPEALGHGDSYTVTDLPVDAEYTLSEDLAGLDGWSIDSIVCSDGSSSGAGETELDGIAVTAGQTTTCTVTNTPDLPTITLEKTAVGDNIAESDFQALLNGGDVDWDAATEVDPGDHTVAETIADGSDVQASWFEAGSWSCDNGDNGASNGATVAVGLGDDVTCSITNTELPSTLTLHKVVTNDDGGNDSQDDFQALLDGGEVNWDEPVTVDALVEHTADEESPAPGYTPSTWTGDCAADGTVTLEPGQDGSCTITNDDVAPTVTVIKEVVNDDGGTAAPADFVLHVDNMDLSTGDTVVVDANTDVVIGEELVEGYQLVDITCDGGTVIGDVIERLVLELDEGENVTCTLVNDDLPASITVVKDATDGVTESDGALLVTFDPTDGDDETITYTYVVTNSGEVALGNITLVDDILGPIAVPDVTLAPGESFEVTAVHVVTEGDGASITNVAVVTGDPIHGAPTVQDDDDETVAVLEVLPEVLERQPEPEQLPKTGTDTGQMVAWAILMMLVGFAVTRLEGRWRTAAGTRG